MYVFSYETKGRRLDEGIELRWMADSPLFVNRRLFARRESLLRVENFLIRSIEKDKEVFGKPESLQQAALENKDLSLLLIYNFHHLRVWEKKQGTGAACLSHFNAILFLNKVASSLCKIFFALGVPIDIPDKSVLFSMYFEANYGLPGEWNSSYYLDEPYLKKRSLDRRLAYDILTNKLESFGYSGKSCLLKIICEIANYPVTNNGVLGEVLQILFTPSSSLDENLPSEITDAEYVKDCNKHYKKCPQSPLTLIKPA
ncbi:hypothetical protein WH47_06053 [Habropoda laboriosa]|uniref:Uncharacterized protein n=1 Tax=Habropoda laboriosa TaxID=597456 RepID=A0A0L7QSD8_9HYME|nr:hypothetical protein WH47_06053 [Habropoda laboriosa]